MSFKINRVQYLATAIAGLLWASVGLAAEYVLPAADQHIIGEVREITATEQDTFVDIARVHGVGYTELRRANPDVDPWIPGAGTTIVLPTRFVLPDARRRGVVLNLAEYRMYYFPPVAQGEQAIVHTYPISIGRQDWETPLGRTRVVAKAERPSWYPPASIRAEHAAEGDPLPAVVPPGPDNPLGEYAMRLGLPGYLIHGTNRPAGVGMRVTHGCIRMFPEDIEQLFAMVPVDTPVQIVNQPVKMGWDGDRLILEAHEPLSSAVEVADEPLPETVETSPDAETVADVSDDEPPVEESALTLLTRAYVAATRDLETAPKVDWPLMESVLGEARGLPVTVGEFSREIADTDPAELAAPESTSAQ
ncbi:MAG: L,D-transpeptidase family protein [Pseudomonadota bacterium]